MSALLFFPSGSTHYLPSHKIELKFHRSSSVHYQYFNPVVLLCNVFSPIHFSLSFITIKKTLQQRFWIPFLKRYDPTIPAHSDVSAFAPHYHTSDINITLPSIS